MTYLEGGAANMPTDRAAQVEDIIFSNKKLIVFAWTAFLLLPLPYFYCGGLDQWSCGFVVAHPLSIGLLYFIMSVASGWIILTLLIVYLLMFVVPKFLKRFYSYFLYIFIVLFGLIPIINAYLITRKSNFPINSVLDTQVIFPLSFLWNGEMLGFYPEYLISYYFGFFMYVCTVCIFLWRRFFKKERVFGIASEKVLGVSMFLFVCVSIYAYLSA